MWNYFVERWGFHHRKKMKDCLETLYLTPRQRLFSSLLAACSLLLTCSVRVASLAMQPRLVELWKCRVQHLRKFNGDLKYKQKGIGTNSNAVWYLPVLMMAWLIAVCSLVFFALSQSSLESLNYQFCEMLHLSSPTCMMVIWWRVARDQQSGLPICKTRHSSDATNCSKQEVRRKSVSAHKGRTEEPEAVSPSIMKCSPPKNNKVVSPQKMGCSWSEVAKIPINQDKRSLLVIHQLLVRAGDVETNPGPEYEEYVEHYLKSEASRALLNKAVDWDNSFNTDLNKIADSMVKWEIYSASLQLMQHEIDDLKSDHSGESSLLLRRAVLRKVRSKDCFSFTYGVLLKICAEKSDPETAKTICEVLNSRAMCMSSKQENVKVNVSASSVDKASEAVAVLREDSYNSDSQICETDGSAGPLSVVRYKKWPFQSNSPQRDYIAQLEHDTKKMKIFFSDFSEQFTESFLAREREGKIKFRKLAVVAKNLFNDDIDLSDLNSEDLLLEILDRQSYLNFDLLMAIVRRCGSPEDKKMCEEYMEAFMQYAKRRIFETASDEMGKGLKDHETLVFVLDKNQLKDVYSFKQNLCSLLDIEPHKIFLKKLEHGSVAISFQVPAEYLTLFETLPLLYKQICCLKEWCTLSYELKSEVVHLSRWNLLSSVDYKDSVKIVQTVGGAEIVSAAVGDGKCLALQYSPTFSNESAAEPTYVKYLESLVCGKYKNLPAVKGLYYPQTLDGEAHQYPAVVVENLTTLKDISLKQEVSTATQISLLSDIATSVASFQDDLNSLISVFADSVLVRDNISDPENIAACFCPLYQHSFIGKQGNIQGKQPSSFLLPLPVEKLQWMKEVVKIIHFQGNVESNEELPESHILKRIFDQKWISGEDRFRPKSFELLSVELQQLLEKERIYMGILAIKYQDDEMVEEEVQIHLILVGHTGVGKTSLRKHLKNEPINEDESPTIVMEPEILYRESIEANQPFRKIKEDLSTSSNKVFLTMWDTGGQPIFQDLLPCFARLKCMYGIVFRLPDLESFDARPDIRPYCKDHDETTLSPFTNEDIVYRNMAYVQAFSSSLQDKIEIPGMFTSDNDESHVSYPAAVIVGTCKDIISSSTHQSIEEKKKELDKGICDFVRSNNVSVFPVSRNQSTFIHEIDNMSSGSYSVDQGIDHLRDNISECAHQSKAKIPKSWRKFEAELQRCSYTSHINVGVIPLLDATAIGKDCQVSDPKAALMYFHELGTFMWYHLSENASMRNFVVIDPKLLLEILAKVFCYDPSSLPIDVRPLISKGIITSDFFANMLEKKASNVDNSWFVAFLEEHHLNMKVSLPGLRACYFLPSLLPTRPDYLQNLPKHGIAPLCIVPQSGYIATGVFTRLLTALTGVSYGSTIWRIPLKDSYTPDVCRNQFEFVVNDSVHIVLTEYSKYIRVDCIPCDKTPLEDGLCFNIASTLDVQLQRIVPQWLEKRAFNFTLHCRIDQCSDSEEHFLVPLTKKFISNHEVVCSKGKKGYILPSQEKWFNSCETYDRSSELYEKSLKEGSLNITIASLLFAGLDCADTINAKRIAFHEPITHEPMQAQCHTVYFRPEGHPDFKKLHYFNLDEAILYSANVENQEILPSTEEDRLLLPDVEISPSPDSIPNIDNASEQETEMSLKESSILIKSPQAQANVGPDSVPDVILPDEVPPPLPDENSLEPLVLQEPQTPKKLAIDFDYLVENMARYKNKGKIEVCHVFSCEAYSHIKEIFSVFIHDVTLGVVVTNSSGEQFEPEEADILYEISSIALKGLMIESSMENRDLREQQLQQYSRLILVPNASGIYIVSMNCKNPQAADYNTGARLISSALQSAPSDSYPFSWYLFGFKLRNFMVSQSIYAVSLSKQAMEIAEELKMDRPTVEAALEHLTKSNVVVYFRDVLNDTIFVSAEPFALIFSDLYRKYYKNTGHQSPLLLNDSEWIETVKRYADDSVSVDDFTLLFRQLMLLVSYKEFHVVPCFLPLLNEGDRRQACKKNATVEPLLIKCPCSGYGYISMLTGFLLNSPGKQWEILTDESGKPVCLFKNCTVFLQKNMNQIVAISFSQSYIEVYLSSHDDPQNFVSIASTILQGLEQISLILRRFQNFDFGNNMAFRCKCSESDSHVAVYDQQLDRLICEKNKVALFPSGIQKKWLNPDQRIYKEFLTVSNAVKALMVMAGQWMRIADQLSVPSSVVDSIVVSRQSDEDSLRRVVKWWFKNTANPEWDAIQKIRSGNQRFQEGQYNNNNKEAPGLMDEYKEKRQHSGWLNKDHHTLRLLLEETQIKFATAESRKDRVQKEVQQKQYECDDLNDQILDLEDEIVVMKSAIEDQMKTILRQDIELKKYKAAAGLPVTAGGLEISKSATVDGEKKLVKSRTHSQARSGSRDVPAESHTETKKLDNPKLDGSMKDEGSSQDIELNSLRVELEDTQFKCAKADSELVDIQNELKRKEEEYEDLKDRVLDLEEEIETLRSVYEDQMITIRKQDTELRQYKYSAGAIPTLRTGGMEVPKLVGIGSIRGNESMTRGSLPPGLKARTQDGDKKPTAYMQPGLHPSSITPNPMSTMHRRTPARGSGQYTSPSPLYGGSSPGPYSFSPYGETPASMRPGMGMEGLPPLTTRKSVSDSSPLSSRPPLPPRRMGSYSSVAGQHIIRQAPYHSGATSSFPPQSGLATHPQGSTSQPAPSRIDTTSTFSLSSRMAIPQGPVSQHGGQSSGLQDNSNGTGVLSSPAPSHHPSSPHGDTNSSPIPPEALPTTN